MNDPAVELPLVMPDNAAARPRIGAERSFAARAAELERLGLAERLARVY